MPHTALARLWVGYELRIPQVDDPRTDTKIIRTQTSIFSRRRIAILMPSTPPVIARKTVNPKSSLKPTKQTARAGLPKPEPTQPFAYADWTWLNGTACNKDAVWDSKYFTPEFRVDTHFMQDYNQPKDHTMGGSTESYRSGEVQLEQLSFGGDLHVGNVRGRILTMFGLFAATTPRNDATAGVAAPRPGREHHSHHGQILTRSSRLASGVGVSHASKTG